MDRPDFTGGAPRTILDSPDNLEDPASVAQPMIVNLGTAAKSAGIACLGLDVSEEDAKNLSASIKKLSGAADQISNMAEPTEATQKYL